MAWCRRGGEFDLDGLAFGGGRNCGAVPQKQSEKQHWCAERTKFAHHDLLIGCGILLVICECLMTGLQGKAAPTCSERLKAHTLRVAENDKPPHKRQPGNDCPPQKVGAGGTAGDRT
jgi:hypothetical protein